MERNVVVSVWAPSAYSPHTILYYKYRYISQISKFGMPVNCWWLGKDLVGYGNICDRKESEFSYWTKMNSHNERITSTFLLFIIFSVKYELLVESVIPLCDSHNDDLFNKILDSSMKHFVEFSCLFIKYTFSTSLDL